MSRSTLPGLPLGDEEKDFFVELMLQFSRIYFVEILGYSVMSTHFHIVLKMLPGKRFSDSDIKKRFIAFWSDDNEFSDDYIPYFREKWSSLSEYTKELKQNFSRFYNKKHRHKGTFWTERFKSIMVEKGNSLINLLAYVELSQELQVSGDLANATHFFGKSKPQGQILNLELY